MGLIIPVLSLYKLLTPVTQLRNLFACVLLLVTPGLFAAGSFFLNLDSIIIRPDIPFKVMPYAINLASYPAAIKNSAIKNLAELNADLVYFAKVNVNKTVYYRLIAGNFSSLQQAKQQLARIKKYYPGAWLNIRHNLEK